MDFMSAVDLPLFDQDREREPAILRRVLALHQRVARADALVVACPEYNGQPTPYLKNLVDWISRLPHVVPGAANAFQGRPALLASATTGHAGGALVLPVAQALFRYVGCQVLADTVSVPYAHEILTGDGPVDDPLLDIEIAGATEAVVAAADRFSGEVRDCRSGVPA